MKTLLLFLFLPSASFAQFTIIQDPDGYCNLRSRPEFGDNVQRKLKNGAIVYAFEAEGGWLNIDYTEHGEIVQGYIYKDRAKLVTDFPEIPTVGQDNNTITLSTNTITVTVSTADFDASKHKLAFYKDNPDQLEKIDGLRYWGRDGGIPATQYKSVAVVMNGIEIVLPPEALAALYEPSLYYTKANYDAANDVLYIHSMNSDGAGGYEVIWKIEKGVFRERQLMYGF